VEPRTPTSTDASTSNPPPPSTKRGEAAAELRRLAAAARRGTRLPSILELTRTLGMSKNTVIGALEDLCSEGLLESRERQGFYVRASRRAPQARGTRLSDLQLDRVAHGMATLLAPGSDDFVTVGGGMAAESLLSTPEWQALLRTSPWRDPRAALRYADPLGEPRLREVLAQKSGAAEVSPDQVLITQGAIEALHHAFVTTSRHTGSRRVVIESPGYFMLAPLLRELGLEPVPVVRRPDGLDLEALAHAARTPLAAVMVNPCHHNPTGHTLSLSDRFEVARLAEERRFFVIEDDLYRGLWLDEPEPPSIHSLVPHRTLYVGSFSKTLGAGLRVGFVVAPPAIIRDLGRRKFLFSLAGDANTQQLVAEFVDRRGYQRHLAEMRDELGRRAQIARVQAGPFGRLGRFAGPYAGGLFWRFQLDPSIDEMRLYAAARQQNVLISPGAFFHHEEPAVTLGQPWMRVNVSQCEGTTLTRVLTTLRDLC
jgi:DNA-binding transcriptional MocR family regulator